MNVYRAASLSLFACVLPINSIDQDVLSAYGVVNLSPFIRSGQTLPIINSGSVAARGRRSERREKEDDDGDGGIKVKCFYLTESCTRRGDVSTHPLTR